MYLRSVASHAPVSAARSNGGERKLRVTIMQQARRLATSRQGASAAVIHHRCASSSPFLVLLENIMSISAPHIQVASSLVHFSSLYQHRAASTSGLEFELTLEHAPVTLELTLLRREQL